jgi:hypothetical protein
MLFSTAGCPCVWATERATVNFSNTMNPPERVLSCRLENNAFRGELRSQVVLRRNDPGQAKLPHPTHRNAKPGTRCYLASVRHADCNSADVTDASQAIWANASIWSQLRVAIFPASSMAWLFQLKNGVCTSAGKHPDPRQSHRRRLQSHGLQSHSFRKVNLYFEAGAAH